MDLGRKVGSRVKLEVRLIRGRLRIGGISLPWIIMKFGWDSKSVIFEQHTPSERPCTGLDGGGGGGGGSRAQVCSINSMWRVFWHEVTQLFVLKVRLVKFKRISQQPQQAPSSIRRPRGYPTGQLKRFWICFDKPLLPAISRCRW